MGPGPMAIDYVQAVWGHYVTTPASQVGQRVVRVKQLIILGLQNITGS